mmetsp:Transcript_12233/g.33480  ORF Transcript_12233/g.33480 Transcript_12233/m.33480 type:complete len:276 (-) Transcript_12233:125-952(-)
MTATPLRLVPVRLDSRQAPGDALPEGAARTERDRVPPAGQFLAHQAPNLRDEVVIGIGIVLQDERHRPRGRSHRRMLQSSEVTSSAANSARDAAHAVLRQLGLLLCAADVELHGDCSFVVGIREVLVNAHVEARHAVAQNLELVQAVRDVVPTLLLRVEVQDVHSHVRLEPLGSLLVLRSCPVVRMTGLQPVAQLRFGQGLKLGGGRRRDTAQTGYGLLGLSPGVLVSQMVQAAVVLHHDPAEVPVERAPAMVRHLDLVREHPEANVLRDVREVP